MKLLAININGFIEVIKVTDNGSYNDLSAVEASTASGDDISVSLIGKAVSLETVNRLDLDGNDLMDSDGNVITRKKASADSVGQAIKDATIAKLKQSEKYPNRYAHAIVIKSKIADINDTKGWDQAALQAYLLDVTVKQINDLISDASFDTAKTVLDSADLSAYYTIEEIGEISTLIGDYLTAEGV